MRKTRINGIRLLASLAMLGLLLCQCGPGVEKETTLQPEPPRAVPEIEPPPAVLMVDRLEQVSGIGSYCWLDPAEGVSLCADMVGIITVEDPLVVPAFFTARFHLSLEEEPEELALGVSAVSTEDELPSAGDGWRAWSSAPVELYALSLQRTPEIKLKLAPGMHVLNLFARWERWGDASYGFLLRVVD